jgi:hypothetical protein
LIDSWKGDIQTIEKWGAGSSTAADNIRRINESISKMERELG